MANVRLAVALLSTTALALGTRAACADPVAALGFEKSIPLEGGTSFDLAATDANGRLYVAHSPGVDVIDVEKGARVGVVAGVERAHGVLVPAGGKRGFAAAGKANRLVVFDTDTLKPVGEVATGEGPDALLEVASTKEVWAFNGDRKSVV